MIERVEWSDDAARVLRDALDGANLDDFASDVRAGVCELWYSGGCYFVLEQKPEGMRVWLAAGKNFRAAACELNQLCIRRGIMYILLRTRHPASLRMYGFMNPEVVNAEMHEYRIWQF